MPIRIEPHRPVSDPPPMEDAGEPSSEERLRERLAELEATKARVEQDAGEPSSEERLREWMGEVEAAKTRVEQDAGEPSSEERLRERLAELEATKARVEREAERASQQTRADLIAKVFPVLDSLDRALVTPSDASALAEGVKMVRDQLAEVLSDFGVSRIESVGRRFDPTEHEAMDVLPVENPADDGKVVEQWQAGFRLGQKVLRPARVRVGKSLPTHQ